MKAPYYGHYMLEQAWMWVLHFHVILANWAMCPSMLLPVLVWGGFAVLPLGPPRPPNIAVVWHIFKHGTILFCWDEPRSLRTLLFLGQEQHTRKFSSVTYLAASFDWLPHIQRQVVTYHHNKYRRYLTSYSNIYTTTAQLGYRSIFRSLYYNHYIK